jgi:hypothetical protein
MVDIAHERKQAAYHQVFRSLWGNLALPARRLFAHRALRLYRDELSPHLARDLGLVDAIEKPVLSTGITEQAPRV